MPAPSRAIRDVRLEQGLSLRALSARAGLPYSTLSKLENGKMALTYDKLIRLAQALNVDIRDMLAAPVQTSAPVAVGRRSITRAGEGLDADWVGRCDRRVTIPMRPGAESLNVAVAAGIILHHFTREVGRGVVTDP